MFSIKHDENTSYSISIYQNSLSNIIWILSYYIKAWHVHAIKSRNLINLLYKTNYMIIK